MMSDENMGLLRPAVQSDAPVLVTHRRRMFEDMARLNNRAIDPAALDAMDAAYLEYIHAHLADGSLAAWVITFDGQICASGAVSIQAGLPPHHANLAGSKAYLHSVYTCPEHRRQGLARRIVEQAIQYCKEQGHTVLDLHASSEGRPLYELLGFQPGTEMRLRLQTIDGR